MNEKNSSLLSWFKGLLTAWHISYCMALEEWASVKVCGMIQEMELRNFRRGRHLYSVGRPSRWASAHILVVSFSQNFAQINSERFHVGLVNFWATIVKRFALCNRTVVCLSDLSYLYF